MAEKGSAKTPPSPRRQKTKPYVKELQLLAKSLEKSTVRTGTTPSPLRWGTFSFDQEKKVDIKEEAARREKIKNDSAEQDTQLKRESLNRLFKMLTIETAVVFLFAFCQAIRWPWEFHLEEWTFKLLLTATISQITYMLSVAIKHLFPTKP